MTIMYQLPVFMPETCTVDPVGVMYQLPNYHAGMYAANGSSTSNGVQNGNGSVAPTDPVQMIEKKQQELIQALTSLGGKLNELLKQKGASAKSEAKPSQVKTSQKEKETSPAPAKDGGKKDKDAKKEARKAAKADAKNKVSSTPGDAKQKSSPKTQGKQWVIKEEKKSTETGQSLTACTAPEYADFNKQALSAVTLTVTSTDLPWVKALAKVGEKRGVAFKGVVSNSSKSTDSTVDVKQGDKFSLKSSSGTVSLRVPAWKILGCALGLFSFEHNHTLQSSHQHQWMVKINEVLSSGVSVVNVVREANQFLSSFDSLGSHFDIGMADVILRSLLPAGNQPNNVELWSGRVDSL